MAYYFLDTSALVKRYIPEAGTTWMRSITASSAGNTIIIEQITQVEIISGASRRKRDGSIPARTAHAIRLIIDRHISREYMVIALTFSVIRRAEDLLEAHPLRAYDAVQLASAIEANNRLTLMGLSALTFVSADNRLVAVANAEGLTTDDPNQYP